MSVSTSPTTGSAWRAGRFWIALGALIVLVAVIGVALAPGTREPRRLDPADTSLEGSKALAELLRERGVTVDRVDSVDAAIAKGDGRLLLVTHTASFDWQQLDRLAQIKGDRVIVGDLDGRDVLAPGVTPAYEPARVRSREPECGLPAARAAGSAYLGGDLFRGANGCYPGPEGSALVQVPGEGGTVTVLGDGSFMTNKHLAEDGNAALALNLLGTKPAVTWLVRPALPPAGDLAGVGGKSLGELVPPSVPWAVVAACLAVLVAAFWRGRRLGPVVAEKLPVVVRAAETVEGRGRLYRARRARERAAAVLRAGTVDRLTPRVGLAPGAGQHEVVAALAVRTGQDAQQIGGALYGPPPADDAGLVALAGYLDFIERIVREH
ncbi:DUF4350 domain-containing protein [Nonomuraea sp. NPDC050790]|uniref:DUF4350 domain-containing protein n=1 Tax=Nonomuraea sp. NPDC050790 TaxID=3364371 RepID=UPI0037A88F17